MVTLGSDDTALFMRTLSSKPSGFFAAHVKCLCLSISVEPVDARRILSICKGVKTLAFWVDYLSAFPDSSLTQLISPLSLHKLSIEAQHLYSICQNPVDTLSESCHNWSDSLTDLDIVFWPDDDVDAFPHLDQFHSLTNVGLWHPHGFVSEEIIWFVLGSCQRLEILLVVVDESDLVQKPALIHDPRVVLMPYPSTIVQDWESSFMGRQNTWLRAKEVHLASIKARKLSHNKPGQWITASSSTVGAHGIF